MNKFYLSDAKLVCYAAFTTDNNDAFVPEHWALEGLAILEENMVMSRLVHRDFSPRLANFGDVVNTRRPGTFRSQRKTDNDDVNSQEAASDNVQVKLDQHHYQSFVIKDGEATLSFQDLVQVYLLPAMQAIARGIDRGLTGMAHKFLGAPTSRAGRLLNISSSNAKDWVLDAREILNKNLAYMTGRNLVLSPSSETALLKTDLFIAANQRGDGGSALESAILGRILGFDTYLDQNVPYIQVTGADVVTGTITSAKDAGDGEGDSQSGTILAYAVPDGVFAVVAGNDQPTWVTAATDDGTDTSAITLNENNKYSTGTNAVVTVYKHCSVNGDYAAEYAKYIVLDGWAANKPPQQGQLIAFGSTANTRHTYRIIESYLSASGEQSVLLDRPLELALSNNQAAFPGPAGAFNFAFHRDALALVSRPMASPPALTGVLSANGVYRDIAMRVTMQYDSKSQGTRTNLDVLTGYAVLDTNLACVLQG